MDRPLGRACGNALETEEAILALRGEGPPDLMEVVYALGVEMLLAAGIERATTKARKRLENTLGAGLAAEKFEQIIEAQGGNPRVLDDPAVLPQALVVEVYATPRTGVVARVEPKTIGRAIVALGGGRSRVEDTIDPTVGFVISVKPGDKVLEGEPIASIYRQGRERRAAGLRRTGPGDRHRGPAPRAAAAARLTPGDHGGRGGADAYAAAARGPQGGSPGLNEDHKRGRLAAARSIAA